MNQCQLMGRLVRDPELKYTPQGTAVTSFTLAVDRRFNRDKADYINIIAWRQTAEFVAKHFAKGQRVAIVGSIQTRSWEDIGIGGLEPRTPATRTMRAVSARTAV